MFNTTFPNNVTLSGETKERLQMLMLCRQLQLGIQSMEFSDETAEENATDNLIELSTVLRYELGCSIEAALDEFVGNDEDKSIFDLKI